MTGLLSLPNELLIQILCVSPTTRTLCELAHVNKRMRAIWLQHAERIITGVYSPKIPYFQDAVDLTLAEERQAATMTIDVAAPEAQPLYRLLPKILQNVDLAVKTCDHFTDFRNSLPSDDPWFGEPTTSLHDAYFVIRRAVLGYTLPGMRSAFCSELRSLQSSHVETCQRLLDYIRSFAPYTLRCELGCLLREEEKKHVPIDDQMTRLPLGWRHAGILLALALQEKEDKVSGLLETVWTSEPVNEEDMEYSDSDFYYDSDEYARSRSSERG